MHLLNLTLAQVRAFEQAQVAFQPGMNLIVGVNGVGKSTVLDTLRFLLSQALPQLTPSRSKAEYFKADDIAVGCDWLYASLKMEAAGVALEYEVREWRDKRRGENIEHGETDEQRDIHRVRDIIEVPPQLQSMKSDMSILRHLKKATEQHLAVYFSTRRSVPIPDANIRQRSAGGYVFAFADSLTHRELRLGEFIEWWLAQKVLADESADPKPVRRLAALEEAVTRFLTGCSNLRARTNPTTLLLDKEGKTLDVRWLSDGERGLLALILDLTRRLALANPELLDPLTEGEAVVLIDELDLHLHPRWQRTVVGNLTRTFPQCQFIATTHSPQIIGEVKSEGLTLIRQEGDRVEVVQRGLQGYGLDSGWILRHLMDTESRNPAAQTQIHRVEDAIEEGDLALAREQLAALRELIQGDDDEVVRLEASINNLEALADEMGDEIADEMGTEAE